jgi:hypothetical protein
MLCNEAAQRLIRTLYYDGCLCLERKRLKAIEALVWKRPTDMRREYTSQKWTPEHDQIVMNETMEKSMELLGRTNRSINMRLHRLKHGLAYGRKQQHD